MVTLFPLPPLFTTMFLILSAVQANTMRWPPGPDNVKELMMWGHRNAQTLLADGIADKTVIQRCRDNFEAVMQHQIDIHDSYSGSGTGSWTMHYQYDHLVRHILSTW